MLLPKLLLPGLLALLLAAASAHAQVAPTGLEGAAGQSNLADFAKGLPAVLSSGAGAGLVGSPYLDPRWLPGRLEVTNARPLPPVALKFDVLGHRLLMRTSLSPGADSLVLDDHRVRGFVLTEPATPGAPARPRTFRRFDEAPLPAQRTSFVEVLHQGRYAVLVYRRKTLQAGTEALPYSTGPRPATILDHTEYYLRPPEGELRPIKLSLKSLQQAAPPLARALQAAGQARKPGSEADWAAVLDAADPAGR